MTTDHAPEKPEFDHTVQTWRDNLVTLSAGLDLASAEDRSIFRLRVTHACVGVRASLIREVGGRLADNPSGNHSAPRCLADTWIALRTQPPHSTLLEHP